MEKSRHYKKAAPSINYSMIGKRDPPVIKFNPPPPLTIEKLAFKFAYSWNLFQEYVKKLEKDRYGLNLVTVSFTDPYTEEIYDQIITQRELDARIALEEFHKCIEDENTNKTKLRTYDQLLIDSDEEESYSDNDDDWNDA